ncbi:MAG: hypothetical protein KDK39_15760 [Leptospiraceae bacterium]|nr:hypothetical protein [Leptospiraceae bacterium]
MTPSSISATAAQAIQVYGGLERWQSAKTIEAEVSVSGLAFRMKRRPFFDHAKITMDVHTPHSRLTPIGKGPAVSGVLHGHHVKLVDGSGKVLAERQNARAAFGWNRRLFFWDDLDMAYFANYAFWNYFTLPALLANTAIEWREQKAGILDARFPAAIPTHSHKQRFYFDTFSGLLKQHNYTADIISVMAYAANVVLEHQSMDGWPFAVRRQVSPQLGGSHSLGVPVLIDIHVHRFQLS